MTVLALIGPTGLYLLFSWLVSAALAANVAERKGYGERTGLAFAMLLWVAGLLFILILPGRPGSRWDAAGWPPRRRRSRERIDDGDDAPPSPSSRST